ncbi:hypothetical protein V6N11_049965 [Hibiscus sabdariffa]|uniref:Uncharacterized protein n=1 Tax=Hibiscus sabdariffa TaxID=183260 RepID=A0ABR2T8G0_9ROSI
MDNGSMLHLRIDRSAPPQFQSAALPVLAQSTSSPVTEVIHTSDALQNSSIDHSNAADPVANEVSDVEVPDVAVPDVVIHHEHQPSCVATPTADTSQLVASVSEPIMVCFSDFDRQDEMSNSPVSLEQHEV